ncbi:PHP domain-containing protein [Gracilinema caldarium]|uniref:PHP domain protein n=1 Tax=Gracilinema caldarium (strain ATCC 51460 / DSM 7334 / H1) TaxID=744872 RepID=F8EYX8_GRAC1|nr:PHP domain-containing protein [Gracilinema caldarium]AEJ18924.1 PHP domain protein [Gracilinema caldarium DSM 7334]
MVKSPNFIVDLHSHSTCSDGILSPEALINMAADMGLRALALTDHDTIAGLASAKCQAIKRNLLFIPGVELEIAWEPGEFHLLGLGIQQPTDEFQTALEELAQLREKRNREIINRMNEMGIEADYEEIKKLSEGTIIGRPHIATFLVNRKIVKNKQSAFDMYLGKGRPFYAPKGALELKRAIRLITESGGIPILAHPLSLYVSWGKLPELIEHFHEQGIVGLEAWHPLARVAECERLEAIGKGLKMVITAGSDYHGNSYQDRRLGYTAGNRPIDGSYLRGIPDTEDWLARESTS